MQGMCLIERDWIITNIIKSFVGCSYAHPRSEGIVVYYIFYENLRNLIVNVIVVYNGKKVVRDREISC